MLESEAERFERDDELDAKYERFLDRYDKLYRKAGDSEYDFDREVLDES